ncbi:MAG TPA: hypothetical protein VNL37_05580, partial [Candidatus Polarisedimenticolia bacterium]|nr:hypothetical protein [Candidatus Polarisedimenticolia bacterium]
MLGALPRGRRPAFTLVGRRRLVDLPGEAGSSATDYAGPDTRRYTGCAMAYNAWFSCINGCPGEFDLRE